MKIIADLVPRFVHLQSLQDDPMVVNTDGSKVDALVEIAAEMYEVPVKQVTFEQRNWAQRIVHGALAADINKQNRTGMAQEAAFNQAYGNKVRRDPFDEALRQHVQRPWWPESK